MAASETTGTQQSARPRVSDPRMKIQDMPTSNEQRALEHHRALTDYTATLTEAVEVAKIPIVERSKDSKPRPILRPTPDLLDSVAFTIKDAPSDFQTVKHGSAADSLIPFADHEITMKQKRVKSATRNKRRFQATQPYTTKSSLGHRAGRPLSGIPLHDVEEQSSTFLVNNLIVNNGAGGISRQHASYQTHTALTGKNSDIMRLPTVSSNRNASRTGGQNAQAAQPSSGRARPGDEITINQVTPELAAQVVKHFVLPMFDTEAKKGLRRKYGRMQVATQYGAQQSHMAGQEQPSQGAPG